MEAPCSVEKKRSCSSRKRKGERTEDEGSRDVVGCSSSSGEEEEEEEEETTEDALTQPPSEESRGVLVRCSSSSWEKKSGSKFCGCSLNLPFVTTVTKTTTTSITIVAPPNEDPHIHLDLYLCIPSGDIFRWFKIDPTLKSPKPKPKPKNKSSSIIFINHNNYNNDHDSKDKKQKKKKKKKKKMKQPRPPPILLSPISNMPPETPYVFHAIPHTFSSDTDKQKKKKLVYAVGGPLLTRHPSAKAFVCDFAATPSPVWKELPPLPSPMHISFAAASPLDGRVFAFGPSPSDRPGVNATHLGFVFDPSKLSWNPCPRLCTELISARYFPITDYALIDNDTHTEKHRKELFVFTSPTVAYAFDLATAYWGRRFDARIPTYPRYTSHSKYYNGRQKETSTSVGVGPLVFRFYDRKLYALDSSSLTSSFKHVPGLDDMLPKYWEALGGGGHMVYLGKGKLCIVWGAPPHSRRNAPEGTLSITCLKFWVGRCNRTNRLRALVDRCERFVAHGYSLDHVVAL